MEQRYHRIVIDIRDKEIKFPKGYFFTCSPVHTLRSIHSKDITEINGNTFPPSLVYKEKELVFIKSELLPELESFAKRNHIPKRNRFDIWEHLNHPFLDTEFEEEEKNYTIQLLSENGISEEELKKIRKKIGRTMWRNLFAWEWTYLGLFNYLSWTFLSKKKYWWAMEIGLRNYKNNP